MLPLGSDAAAWFGCYRLVRMLPLGSAAIAWFGCYHLSTENIRASRTPKWRINSCPILRVVLILSTLIVWSGRCSKERSLVCQDNKIIAYLLKLF